MAHLRTFTNVKQNTLNELRDSGCKELFIGIESGFPKMLESINKASDTDLIKKNLSKLKLTKEEIDILQQKGNSQPLPKQEIQRSKILLLYYQGLGISEIERRVGVSRPTIYKCIDKALAGGVKIGLKDMAMP